MNVVADPLVYPFTPPGPGEVLRVAEGVLQARIALPFSLDHVNVYFLEDGDGWAIVDTGIDDAATRAAWEALAAGPFRDTRFTRLIVTHYHPDHIGLAGWLCERFGLELVTTQTSYLGCLNISLSPNALDAQIYRDFYLRHGLDAKTTQLVTTSGHGYLRMVSPLPPTFRRIVAGDTLKIGAREFKILTADGHAPEQAMLYCEADRLLIVADQILAKISPNVSVWAVEPEGDPLGLYLRSQRGFIDAFPEDVLVLPGHQSIFYGLHARARQLIEHHEQRCALLAQACREAPKTVAECVPVMFRRPLDPHQLSFAFSEVLAHVNYMLGRGELRYVETPAGAAQDATRRLAAS